MVKGETTMEKNNNTSGGIGFVGLLTICFIVLKLIGIINWSWLWVISPIWITAIIAIMLVILIIIMEVIR